MIADCLFYSVCAGALSLCILRYYRVSLGWSAALALLFALATGGILFLLLHTKHRKLRLSKKEAEEKNALLFHLALERPERVRALLLAAFREDEKDAHCEGDELRVDGVTTVPMFSMQPVSADDIAKLIRFYGEEPFSIACNALSAESESLLSSFGIKAIRGKEIYALCKRTNCIPERLFCGDTPRRTAKAKLQRTFSKKNARPFFVSGLVLLCMSLFTLFPVYYLITGSVLLVSAVTVRAFGYA